MNYSIRSAALRFGNSRSERRFPRLTHRATGRTTFLAAVAMLVPWALPALAQPLVERLDRGVVAVHQPDGSVFVSWRLLASDPEGIAFHVYRQSTSPRVNDNSTMPPPQRRFNDPVRLNDRPLREGTWFVDREADLRFETAYFVQSTVNGREGEPSRAFTFAAHAPPRPYVSVPLQTPDGYTPGDASLADLDGDGDYEIILKQEQQPRDNSHAGFTGETLLQAYRTDGTHLWTINLGRNIREGAHYTQFIVYDLDGDGRAEVACKTADGTIDGYGDVIGDPKADWREPASSGERLQGRILRGAEYFTIFDGSTGKALATTKYLPGRHPETDSPTPEQATAIWGDGHGNRSDRFLAGVAYLDGERPSVIMCRGYYTRSVIAAWDWRDGTLTSRWVFDSDEHGPADASNPWRGQGNHQLSVADVDGDGRDEIVYGAMVVDDNGAGLYSTGWGHGDALHVGDFVPDNPGLEIFDIQERFGDQGMSMRDAGTGRPIFTVPAVRAATAGGDRGEGPGRGNAFDIDPRFPGAESWSAGAGMDGLFTAAGEKFLEHRPRGFPCNFAVWWDGDLLRELLDQNRVMKWNWESEALETLLVAEECTSNNGTKATPAVSADLWGDWREEVVWRTRDNRELHIYTTTIPTPHRMVTLMHDPQYRVAIAWQNVAYNQPPHPGFRLEEGSLVPPRPPVRVPLPRRMLPR